MSAQNRTQDKAARPADLEDKALDVAIETKAVAAPEDGNLVDFKLAHYLSVQGKEYAPGETVKIAADLADRMRRAGAGALV